MHVQVKTEARPEASNGERYETLRVFFNGLSAGLLTVRADEAEEFRALMKRGCEEVGHRYSQTPERQQTGG